MIGRACFFIAKVLRAISEIHSAGTCFGFGGKSWVDLDWVSPEENGFRTVIAFVYRDTWQLEVDIRGSEMRYLRIYFV